MLTKVEINESIQKQLDEVIRGGLFDAEVRDLIAFWIMEIKEIGSEEYIKSALPKSFNDHAFQVKRQGERAIDINPTGSRFIYKYYKNKIIVKVIKISHDHDYNEEEIMESIDKVELTSGKSLKALRLRFGFTQNDVATAIGVSVSNLSAIENDKRNLGVDLAAKFCCPLWCQN